MATTRIQAATGSGTTSVSVTLGAAPTVGNLLVAWVTCLSSGSVTATNGFTELTLASSDNPKGRLMWKVADAGDHGSATVAVATFGSGFAGQAVLVEWSTTTGWGTGPVDTENVQAFASTTHPTTPTVTPTAGIANALVATGYANTSGKGTSAEAVTGSNVGTVTEDGETGSPSGVALATAAISSTSGAYQGSATLANPGGAGFSAIAVFAPAPTETPATRDTTARFRLQVRKYKDATIRFALRQAMVRDATIRVRLRATAFKDVTARMRLYVRRYQDATARVNVALAVGQAYRDASARLRLAAVGWRDATFRIIAVSVGSRDVTLRVRANVRRTKDATVRLTLQSGSGQGQEMFTFSSAYNASGNQGLSEVRTAVSSRTEYGPKVVE